MRGVQTVRAMVACLACVLFACQSAPGGTNFGPMLRDPVFTIDVPGGVPTGPVLGNDGSDYGGPWQTPTTAFRSWTATGDPDATFARALVQLRRLGVTFTLVACQRIDGSPDFIASGIKTVGDRGASATISLQGTKFTIQLDSSPGSAQAEPSRERIIYDGSCPSRTDLAVRSMA